MPTKVWVLDVDGTVANNQHRSHLISGPTPDWAAYFQYNLVMEDSPIETAQTHFVDGNFKHGPFLYLTARPESARIATTRWLMANGFATPWTRILMKPDIIRLQRSSIFKPCALRGLQEEYAHPLVMVDDHPDVLSALADTEFETRTAPNCWEEECWT